MTAYGATAGSIAGDGFPVSPTMPGGAPESVAPHPLDSEENSRLLKRLEEWWVETRDCHAENRREMLMDADYYDCLQWSIDDAASLTDRGQAPLTFPLVKQMCDWVIGTERRTRIDWDVLPRKDASVDMANVKKEVLKFISDVNGSGWERSQQFADEVKVGVGWTEQCYNNDASEEPITDRYQDWKGMWWDPYSRSNVMRDCRYITRAKWLDLDYAIAMWPDRAAELTAKAIDTLDPVLESLELESSLPQMFFGTPMPMRGGLSGGTFGTFGTATITRRARRRILGLETWFKRSVNTPLLLGDSGDDLNGQPFERANQDHQQALKTGVVSLVDSVSEQMWFALWTPGVLLRVSKSPYKHKKFPFTPAWAYRRHRDGMPYGIVRPAKDAQTEYNKRRSKILFDLSTNRVFYENDAFDEADQDRALTEIKRPDGEVPLAKGGLAKIKVDRATDAVAGQIQMLAEAKNNINECSGVTRENTGTSAGDQSGRAILAKQQQGSVTTAELFDNFRQAIQESGQKTLSNCEQFLSLPKIIRITGPSGALEWIGINQPTYDPTAGKVLWNNDITQDEADFVVDETDYRETVRMALSELLFEMIGRMPPNVAMALLDIAVEMTDLPSSTRIALANRIRQATGQPAPGQENDPQVLADQQAKAAAAQRQQELADAQATANLGLTQGRTAQANAKANLDQTAARAAAVRGKADAMNTAATVHAAPALAPAADKLWNPQTAFPLPPGEYPTPET